MATWRQEFFGPGLDAYDPFDRRRSPIGPPLPPVTQVTAPVAPPLAPLPPIAQQAGEAGPSRSEQAARLAQDIAYGRSDWERAGQAVLGAGQYEDASGLRRAGAAAGGVALGALALASWIPGFNVFKPAQAARAARAFGQGAAQGARAGTGIVRGGLDEAAALEQARRAARAAERAGETAGIAGARGRNIVDDLAQERRTFYDYQYTLPQDRLAEIPPEYRRIQEVLHRQGFDNLPQRISPSDFSRLADEGHIPIYRGFWDQNPTVARNWADSTISGPMRVHDGVYGSGIYVATDPAYALSYATPTGGIYNTDGQLIRGFINKDANLLVRPAAGEAPSPQFRAAVEAFEAAQGRGLDVGQALPDVYDTQRLLFSEFLAASGYDGLLVPATGELVLFNRSITAWQNPVAVPAAVYSEPYTSVERARQIIDSLFSGRGYSAPSVPPSRPATPGTYPSQTGL